MKRYRLNSVEITPTGTIPVLIACDQRKADGVAVHVSSSEEARKLGCVRVIDSRALALFTNKDAKKRKAFEREYGSVSDDDRFHLWGMLILLRAIKSRDSALLDLAVRRLTKGPFPDLGRQVLERQPGIELGRRLAAGMRGSELILWWKDDGTSSEILPGLRCPDVRSALYTLAVLQMEGGEGLGACVVCGQPFVRQRRTRKTCSGKCRYLLFSQRRRMKLKGRTKR